MKRLILFVAAGFLLGLLVQNVLITPHVLAQTPALPRKQAPLANQRFGLVDQNGSPVGGLEFDSAGLPVLEFKNGNQYAQSLGGREILVPIDIRPSGATRHVYR